jgi:D-inositol-3-phosphate glycosyltransferase
VPLVHSQHTLGLVKNWFLAPGDLPEPQHRVDGEVEVIRSADVLIASTDDEWQQLSCLYGAPHDRLKTIHPGVDHALFRPADRAAARAKLGLPSAGPVLLYVGRIQPLKGLDLAVRAAEHLPHDLRRDLTFVIVGGASGSKGAEELARVRGMVSSLGLDDVFRFVGPQRHRDLPAYYQAADALTVCSHSESFGLAALEAHACGTPVVGTAVGGLSYIVRNTESGFLLESRDPALFAAHLGDLLTDGSRWAEFSDAALKAAAAFSWEETGIQMLELYDCLARDRAPEVCTC